MAVSVASALVFIIFSPLILPPRTSLQCALILFCEILVLYYKLVLTVLMVLIY